MNRSAIVLHGGAGRGSPEAPSQEPGLRRAAARGWAVLEAGGNSLDAVVEAVAILEDDEAFNAGFGSVLTEAGTVENDASVMDGQRLAAGGVAASTRLRNPIRAARAVLERTPHVMMTGEAVELRAEEWGLASCAPEALVSERQRHRWKSGRDPHTGNTVGAVAVDSSGHLAAATSTGGTFLKAPGRIGDSAVIGAGTYADDRSGAVSATGVGEAIIVAGLARVIALRLESGCGPLDAIDASVRAMMARSSADVGVIAVDPYGRLGWMTTAASMAIAWRHPPMPDVEFAVVCR